MVNMVIRFVLFLSDIVLFYRFMGEPRQRKHESKSVSGKDRTKDRDQTQQSDKDKTGDETKKTKKVW